VNYADNSNPHYSDQEQDPSTQFIMSPNRKQLPYFQLQIVGSP